MGIKFYQEDRIFKLDAYETSYILQVIEGNFLAQVYYGQAITDYELGYLIPYDNIGFSAIPEDLKTRRSSLDTIPLVYPCSGISDFRESCLQVFDQQGMSACDIRYCSHEIYPGKPKVAGLPATFVNEEEEAETLAITCKDEHLGLEVILYFTVFNQLNVITRHAKVTNYAQKPINLERALSTCVEFGHAEWDMISLHGSWATERKMQRFPLHKGKQQVDSIRGASSHQHNPFIALASQGTCEDYGEVYGFNFVYSGNFQATVEVSQLDYTRVVMGINSYDFKWLLETGESFVTPECVMVYSHTGLGGMTRTFHDLYRNHLIRGIYKDKKRPILINNWEATYFNFNTQKLLDIAREAKDLGIEMLVMDDGWFGKRDNDRSGLGDWFVNETKLEGGLAQLVEAVNKLGMKFGIWFEPEMVSPDSDLYRAHPDWCIHIAGRSRSQARQQLVLDMSREDVRAYLFERISSILGSCNIEYVKWDMNRHMTEVGSSLLEARRQRELPHRYILGVYELMEQLTTAFPHVLLENCSGGGGRFDPGMLYYSPQIWASDDTDAIERLSIQHGTALIYPIASIGAHVSAIPNHQANRMTPLKTRGHVALAGTFGYELDINLLSEVEKELVKEQVQMYHQYNDLVRSGDYYRLAEQNELYASWSFVAKNKEEVLVEYVQIRCEVNKPARKIKLKGLSPEANYLNEETGQVLKGETWMRAGMVIPYLWGDSLSYICHFKQVKA